MLTSHNIRIYGLPIAVALASALLLLVIRRLALRFCRGWAGKSEKGLRVYDTFVEALRAPSVYWCLAAGLYIGAEVSDLPRKYVAPFSTAIYVIVILSVTVAAANLAVLLFRWYVQKANMPVSTTGLVGAVIKGSLLVVGVLVILGTLGISVAPLLTAFGVGGLAVALGLQDTLANFFAGLHVLMEKSVRVGDFIRLESGQEGYVEDITWRTTRVRMLTKSVVVIPNRKLAQSVVTNYYLPDTRVSVSIPIRVGYSADADLVERIIREESEAAFPDLPGVVEGQGPSVSFNFGESSLDFSLDLDVKEFADQYRVRNELRKRIFRRFRTEGIEMAMPARTIYMRETKEGSGPSGAIE